MKKILPIFIFFVLFINSVLSSPSVFAQATPTPVGPLPIGGATITPAPRPTSTIPQGAWVEDPDVTFAGKLAARASKTLDWILAHPDWIESGNSSSISSFWATIRNIVYAFLALFVLVTAFVLIITRGKSIAARRFLPRFLFAAILITLSFSLVQFLYQITDIIQRMFLQISGRQIQSSDLLNIAFDYDAFQGFRRVGLKFEESAFISILLVKLTSITFYIMAGILIVRKIILWFFIAVSPLFPLLLFYYPLRNSAKIWLGEFFRWLLYGPLFAIFLFALVSIWKQGGLPLFFGPDVKDNNAYKTCQDLKNGGIDCYPVSINILLGGPGQKIGYQEGANAYENSVNSPSRFGLYVTALIMLWVVIVLPFILLQIFLDYFFTYAASESSIINKIVNKGSAILKPPPPPTPTPTGPTSPSLSHGMARVFSGSNPVEPASPIISPPTSTGMAREIPRSDSMSRPADVSRTVDISRADTNSQREEHTIQASQLRDTQITKQIMKSVDVAVPTITDIARYETSTLTNNIENHQQIANTRETLQKIANPNVIRNPIERQRFNTLKDTLIKQQQAGNIMASSILSASTITMQEKNNQFKETIQKLANPASITNVSDQKIFQDLRQQFLTEAQKGNSTAQQVVNVLNSYSHASNTTQTNNINQTNNTNQTNSTQILQQLEQKLEDAQQKKDNLATTLLTMASKPKEKITAPKQFPVANRVQSVSLEDYESVKKLWQENYQKLDAPKVGGAVMDKKQWLQKDVANIQETINLLLSSDQAKNKEGMSHVSSILPFLLIGGFSQSEVIAYLKAKQEAAKSVLSDMDKKDEDEETLVDKEEKPARNASQGDAGGPKEMAMEVEEPEETKETEDTQGTISGTNGSGEIKDANA